MDKAPKAPGKSSNGAQSRDQAEDGADRDQAEDLAQGGDQAEDGGQARYQTQDGAQSRDQAEGFDHVPVGEAAPAATDAPEATAATARLLTENQRVLLGDLFAVVEEHAGEGGETVDRNLIQQALAFACERHADQRRASGEDFIVHPVGVAKICAGMRLDTATLCAALLHDTVEDTSASLAEVEAEFGEEVAGLVDGVTKLSGVTFQSRDDRQAENYRKMLVAMARDIRVILIKLADRLHNMRTLGGHAQAEAARTRPSETLEIFAPLAHRLGIHAIKWELEDLAFATLHPRKYDEIKGLVNQQRAEREDYVSTGGRDPAQGARGRGHLGRHLRPRQALLLDLLEDDQEGPRVQRDLRPHRDARPRGLGQGLLRGHRRSSTRCGSRCPGASRTGWRCPSSTSTRPCTPP